MFITIIQNSFAKDNYTKVMEETYLMPNKAAKDGVVTNGQSSYQVINNAKNFEGVYSSDFDVVNLLEVGAYQYLQPVTLSPMSSMAIADKFQNVTLTENV